MMYTLLLDILVRALQTGLRCGVLLFDREAYGGVTS